MLRLKQRTTCEPAFKTAMGEVYIFIKQQMEFVPIFGVNVI